MVCGNVNCVIGIALQENVENSYQNLHTFHQPKTRVPVGLKRGVQLSSVHFNTRLNYTYKCTHTRLMALFPGLPRSAGTRKANPIWILLTQETVSGSGISWAICKSAPCSRQITTLAPHHSVFYRPDALPATQPTVSEH